MKAIWLGVQIGHNDTFFNQRSKINGTFRFLETFFDVLPPRLGS